MSELWPGRKGPHVDYISFPPALSWQTAFPRKIVILGSTGSIGRNALAVIDQNASLFSVQGLSCGSNASLLVAQAGKYRPPYLAVATEEVRARVEDALPANYRPTIFVGQEGYAKLATVPEATTVLSAQSGAAGLAGTLAAALAGRVICLANKESLVLAGSLVRDIAALTGSALLPVDSEHNAIFQCLAGRDQDIDTIVLTASGGPFRGLAFDQMANMRPEQALAHPNWKMGRKISIDSATMMNKGLEIIEAFHLYGVAKDHIEVVIHPQSLIHSLVRLRDGSLLAQLGQADMKLPLAHCLTWPCRAQSVTPKLDLTKVGQVSFEEADEEAFPCLALAKRALAERGGMCVVLNAANEAAVELFLNGQVSFGAIPRLIARALDAHAATSPGHQPFCPPLADRAKNLDDLRQLVRKAEKRIVLLDQKSRDFVRAIAQEERMP
ncbi:MAG: 1-deoxy-D-xylulose-5-phosphate reductoisomerase [Desulfovibrio sp.]|nr:1-deoxy-D-xylulose-5-phosphate reductoisomerase [Desulfovibrio sp.]